MSIVLQSSGGGQITIQEPTTASNFTQNLPAATGTTVLTDVAGTIGLNATGANIITASTNGSERMRINSAGDVGVGTASPQAKFQVDSSSATYSANIRARNSNFGNGVIGAASGILTVATDMNNMAFYTGSNLGVDGTSVPTNERMRINSSGDVGINNTGLTSCRFGVSEDGSIRNAIGVNNTASGSGSQAFVSFQRNTTQTGSISNTNSATAYNTSSDYRLKENIVPMTGALATVSALKPVTYKWKEDGSEGQGFIAHELQAVVPDCVTGEKDAVDAEGKPVYQGIDTSFLVATLTAAIQELKTELDSVKAELATLKGTA
jgi:hypothetical protein